MSLTNHQTRLALGGDVTLVLVSDDQDDVRQCFEELWHSIFTFERQFSRFLPTSELSLFNKQAGLKVTISPELKALLLASKRMAHLTGGLYNPFILPVLQRIGYKHSMVKGYEKDQVDDHSKKSVVGASKLEIGDSWARIPYGTALDMGGCGKGYLADQLSKQIKGRVEGYWFSLGGDIVADGVDESGKAWQVNIQGAFGKGVEGVIKLPKNSKSAVATSGTTIRKGKTKGRAWHHLIDPKTMLPAETDVALATVYGKSALETDVLASCAVIIGSKGAFSFLKKRKIKAVLLQSINNKQTVNSFYGRIKLGK